MIPILEFDKLAPEDILNRDIQAEENVSAASPRARTSAMMASTAASTSASARMSRLRISSGFKASN